MCNAIGASVVGQSCGVALIRLDGGGARQQSDQGVSTQKESKFQHSHQWVRTTLPYPIQVLCRDDAPLHWSLLVSC